MTTKSNKLILLTLAVFMFVSSLFVFTGCASENEDDITEIPADKYPIVTMEIEGYGKVEIELYPNEAPNTVNNFISLVESKFYDGQKILRVCENFCIQMGSPTGDPADDCGYAIKGEFSSNGFNKNTIKHEAGVISMARSTDPDSAGSQFFICTASNLSVSNLNYDYAAFGKVISGLDIIVSISEVAHNYSYGNAGGGAPLTDVIVKSMTVDTKGIEYDAPKKINQ